jgi:hypothetical protein
MDGIDLTKLVPKETELSKRVTWVEFKGVKFLVRYISRATLMSIAEQCTIAGYDPQAKARSRRLNPDKYVEEIATTMIKDWDNCTLETLSRLMVFDGGLPADKMQEKIPFNKDNLMMVIRNVHELDGFIQECAIDASLFKPVQDGELTKNLPSSPSTT